MPVVANLFAPPLGMPNPLNHPINLALPPMAGFQLPPRPPAPPMNPNNPLFLPLNLFNAPPPPVPMVAPPVAPADVAPRDPAHGGSKASGLVRRRIAEKKLLRGKVKNPSKSLLALLNALPKKTIKQYVLPNAAEPEPKKKKRTTKGKSKGKQTSIADFFSNH